MTKKYTTVWPTIALGIVAMLLMASPVAAQQPTADEINAVAKKLSCPTCTGINVADCPTETCAQWRAKIGELLTEGKSEQEILDYFATRYGDHVLQVPPKHGFFVWVWALPVLALMAGLAWLAYSMRAWVGRRGKAPGVPDQPVVEEEYLRRVQQDLEKLA